MCFVEKRCGKRRCSVRVYINVVVRGRNVNTCANARKDGPAGSAMIGNEDEPIPAFSPPQGRRTFLSACGATDPKSRTRTAVPYHPETPRRVVGTRCVASVESFVPALAGDTSSSPISNAPASGCCGAEGSRTRTTSRITCGEHSLTNAVTHPPLPPRASPSKRRHGPQSNHLQSQGLLLRPRRQPLCRPRAHPRAAPVGDGGAHDDPPAGLRAQCAGEQRPRQARIRQGHVGGR